ncbi:universal stress protein [Falsigemmobacter intermedius]|uniref:universal stress protein n=1 Tax=Falsigemmobacter intermedius TaxID=1553448 RepID=UPI003F08DAE0
MFRHILTATDGSDWAGKGVTKAIGLAAALNAKLTVVMASESYPDYLYAADLSPYAGTVFTPEQMETNRTAMQSHADEVLALVSEEARKQGVHPRLLYVPNTHPAVAITEKAAEEGCDLIVIGSRGRRGITKLVLGSQAAEVLAGTQLPVMIVK